MTGLSSLSATTLTGTLQTAAQTNITSVGTLSSLTLATAGTGLQIPALKFWDGTSTYITFNQSYYLSITEGSADASKALVSNSTKDLSGLRDLNISRNFTASTSIASPTITTDTITKSGAAITSTAAEINYLHLTTGPGTAEASKALVLDASSNISGIHIFKSKNLIASQSQSTPLTTTSVATSYNLLLHNDSDTTGTNSTIAFMNDSFGTLSGFVPSARIYSSRDNGAVGASDLIFGTKSGGGTMSAIADRLCIKSGSVGQTCIGSNFSTTTSMLNVCGSSSLLYGSWERVQEWTNDQATPMKVELIIYNEAGGSSTNGASFGTFTNDHLSFMITGSNKMYLNTSGRLGIGNTSPEAALHVSGGIIGTDQYYLKSAVNGASYRFNWSGVGYGAIGWDNTNGQRIRLGIANADGSWAGYPNCVFGGPYTNGSDRRLKYSIEDSKYGLSVVMKMQSRRFKWRASDDGTFSLGFIAQEVKPLVSEVVSGDESCPKDENGMIAYPMGIEMSGLIPVLCKAIQEQQSQIEILEKDRIDVHSRLDELRSIIQSIKKIQLF
ncbi:hypothetical protein JG688_00015280 [Phytophthora aleatoria]|uniref:Peptidase S74 domain-containing protein n=1 Tax=Phytophthora aleatoria TaxID=2496075 RepID=A0A8J5M2S7_9STRA|nr:hypothetical protein JG688_00015280 [Phytophthora aleatoria]